MESFNANKVLPKYMILKSAQTHLFRIGLCLTNNNNYELRSSFHNPLLIFCIIVISIMKNIISLILSEENQNLRVIIGDFYDFLGIRVHFNIASGLEMILALSSQLIYYFNYKNDIKPNYLKVFEMMSGLVSPKSIGITDEKQILKLIKLTKLSFFICKLIIEKTVPLGAFALSFFAFFINCSIMDTMIFGIPYSLLFSWMCYYIFSINYWQVVYLHIICYYIKIKLKRLNNQIISKSSSLRKMNSQSVDKLIRPFSSIYSEINQYNNNFWSKYLLTIWLLVGICIVVLLYIIIFIEMNIICRILLIYATGVQVLIFLFIINTTSSVNFEANKSYKLLNQLMVYSGKPVENIVLNRSVYSAKIKVIQKYIQNLIISYKKIIFSIS